MRSETVWALGSKTAVYVSPPSPPNCFADQDDHVTTLPLGSRDAATGTSGKLMVGPHCPLLADTGVKPQDTGTKAETKPGDDTGITPTDTGGEGGGDSKPSDTACRARNSASPAREVAQRMAPRAIDSTRARSRFARVPRAAGLRITTVSFKSGSGLWSFLQTESA